METTVIKNFKGGEKEISAQMFDDEYGKIMKAVLKPGASIGYHKHEGNGEIVYAISGNAKVLYNDGEESFSAGQCHYCPNGNSHSIINTGVRTLLCSVLFLYRSDFWFYLDYWKSALVIKYY